MRSVLRGKQRRYLRGLGVNRKPNVLLGKASLSPAVRTELDQVLVAQLNGRTPNSQNSFREACQDLKGFGWREET